HTSGTVFHAFLGEKLPDWRAAASIVRKISENYRLPYYTLSPTYSVCRKHGYIAGEHFNCPECGESAEVYSRITGYYRPVQNFNDGKSQEYKDRKEYNLETSVLNKNKPIVTCCGESMAEASLADAPDYEDKYYLFATKTCPNCKVAASMLEKAGIPYEKLYVDENEEMAKKLGLKQAPTLVIINGESNIKFAGIPAIRKYIDSAAK
ncbi:MAG: glutathione S-transferase N-terminal domain-containing protein, partial [Clostridia bacterium]|nr:glutathione S-transferase N-terminal domain-containing protein [Clostridia bacterium]